MNSYTEYNLYTTDDGIIGVCQTNDDRDLGYANDYAEWDERFKDIQSMLHRTSGGTHIGLYGQPVRVYLDGTLVEGYKDSEGKWAGVKEVDNPERYR